jgi:hypothetical protein
MEEKRKSSRHAASEEVVFECVSCGTQDEYHGTTNDISSTGMRLETEHPVEDGQLLRIISQDFSEEERYATIIWSMRDKSNFRAGVKFVGEEAAGDFVLQKETEH